MMNILYHDEQFYITNYLMLLPIITISINYYYTVAHLPFCQFIKKPNGAKRNKCCSG